MDGLLKDVIAAKEKDCEKECAKLNNEIVGLRQQLAEKQNTLSKVIPYFVSCKKSLAHIEVELGMQNTNDSVVDLTSSSPATAAAQPNAVKTPVASTRAPVAPRVGLPRMRRKFSELEVNDPS